MGPPGACAGECGKLRHSGSFHIYVYTVNILQCNDSVNDPDTFVCNALVTVRIECVCEGGHLSRVNDHAIVALVANLNPSDNVQCTSPESMQVFCGIKLRAPSQREREWLICIACSCNFSVNHYLLVSHKTHGQQFQEILSDISLLRRRSVRTDPMRPDPS